jgi:hypothetical protein
MSLEIVQVDGRSGVADFVDVPFRIPALTNSAHWVPPLRIMVRDALDTKNNPFYRAADRALFVARRDGKPVGRIAAIENRAHNETHNDRVGFFGFFEAADDVDATKELLKAASTWLAARGLTTMRGPMNPSTNYECGLLVDGYEEHPQFLTTWNPPYYDALMTAAGLVSSQELVGYWLTYGQADPEKHGRVAALAERAKTRANLTFRDVRMDRFQEEVQICWDVYNAAWEQNWGFVPMSRDEFWHMAKDLKALLIPQFAFIAEIKGQPAGFMLTVPDYNLPLKANRNGRLFPLGLLRLLRAKSTLRTGRIMAMGIKKEFRTGSILPVFVHEMAQRANAYGSPGGEASWILENNQPMRQVIENWGGRLYRRWRIYDGATTARS